MTRFLTTVFLFLTLLAASPAVLAQRSQYVGYRHKGVVVGQKLPNGLKDMGGGLLSDDSYGVTRYSKGKKQFLWLEKIVSRDQNGVPTWLVRDVLEFSRLPKNQDFSFSYSSICSNDKVFDLDLVVMTELAADRKSHRVLRAWRANVRTGKFQTAGIKGIRCEAPLT
jgi:hypothetical protein